MIESQSLNLFLQPECVMMFGDATRAGLWNDENCRAAAGYICKMEKSKCDLLKRRMICYT